MREDRDDADLGPPLSHELAAALGKGGVLPPRWWEEACLVGPFTPTGDGGNEGIVRDAAGQFVCDTRGYEARADVIAALLNRVIGWYKPPLPYSPCEGE